MAAAPLWQAVLRCLYPRCGVGRLYAGWLLWATLRITLAILLMRPPKGALVLQQYRHRAMEIGL